MNEIFNRRSIRRYKDTPLSADQVDLLMKAAMCAPSARNIRPWEFIFIDDRSILERIAEVHPFAKMLHTAPCAIIVCALPDKSPGVSDVYFPQDCAAATENILLQACSMGLGSVWCGVYPRQERLSGISAVLQLPSDVIPFNVIAIGYADEIPRPMEKFDSKIIHHNKW
jgi:nitroreductase